MRESTLSDKALRNIYDAHRAAIYFQSDSMIDATISTKDFSCQREFCEAVEIIKKREPEKIKPEKIKVNRKKFEEILKEQKVNGYKKFAE